MKVTLPDSQFHWRCGRVQITATPEQVSLGNLTLGTFRRAEAQLFTNNPVQVGLALLALPGFMVWWAYAATPQTPVSWWTLGISGIVALVISMFYAVTIRAGDSVVTCNCVGLPLLSYLWARRRCAQLNTWRIKSMHTSAPGYTFGEWLKIQLEARRWTPSKLARASHLSSVNAILEDRAEPSFIARERLAQGLQLPASTVHELYAQTRELALERARAAKIQQLIHDCRALLSLNAPKAKALWQEQWLLKQFEALPVADRAEVLAAIADLPTVREEWLVQLNALLPAQELPA